MKRPHLEKYKMKLKNLRYLRVDNETLHINSLLFSFVITLNSNFFYLSHISSSNALSLSLYIYIYFIGYKELFYIPNSVQSYVILVSWWFVLITITNSEYISENIYITSFQKWRARCATIH
jgi:hypothetical protein